VPSRCSRITRHQQKIAGAMSDEELNSIQMCRMKNSECFRNEKIFLETEWTHIPASFAGN
jgi:hypothetical protein